MEPEQLDSARSFRLIRSTLPVFRVDAGSKSRPALVGDGAVLDAARHGNHFRRLRSWIAPGRTVRLLSRISLTTRTIRLVVMMVPGERAFDFTASNCPFNSRRPRIPVSSTGKLLREIDLFMNKCQSPRVSKACFRDCPSLTPVPGVGLPNHAFIGCQMRNFRH